jgi:hypothetical protein
MSNIHTFERIQGTAIAEAEKVPCSKSTYHRGLAAMFHTLKEALEAEGIDPLDPEYLDDSDDEAEDGAQ